MNKDLILIWFFWILYCILHSVLASSFVKNNIQEVLRLTSGRYRLFYNVFAFVSLLLLLAFHLSVDSYTVFYFPFWNKAIGILFSVTGMVIMGVCIVKYFRQMIGISSIHKEHALHVNGLHRYVRHPLYSGTFILLIGLFLIFPLMKNGLAAVTIIIYTIIAIRFEEMKLIKQFGEDYITYRNNVPMLIPFLK